MNTENPLVNSTPPREATGIFKRLYDQIVGNGNPDKYLEREAPPTLDQRLHREIAVKLNQPDQLS